MNTMYSILSAYIRPEIQEKVTLGFLLVGTGNVFFNYSANKLRAMKHLLNDESYHLLRTSLRNIEVTACAEKSEAMFSVEMARNTFSKEYIDYLSRYNNNLLSFSSPKEIRIEATEENFRKLFLQLVDDSELQVNAKVKVKSIETFKAQYRPKLIKHFTIERELTVKEIPHLIAPVKPDLIGRNKIPVFAHGIDLEQRLDRVEYEIAQLLFLRTAFEQEKLPSHGFVLTSEPEEKKSKNHQIWKQLRENSPFKYIHISEGEKIVEYAKKHDVTPWIQAAA